jgi:NAD kinase
MDPLTERKIILVSRRTRLDDLIAKFNTVDQAKFYVEHLGADFSDYVRERDTYRAALTQAEGILRELGRVQTLARSFLPNFLFGKDDTVVVLGQDGLVANTVKYLSMQPVIGVNPDPPRWDGVLLPFTVPDLSQIVPEVFAARRQIKEVTMAKAELNNGQHLHAVNDLFIGPKSHVSARYVIRIGGREEQHSSSGIIVSTGLGSTGWLKSLLAGAVGVSNSLAGSQGSHSIVSAQSSFDWSANHLLFTVREPFPSKTSAASLVFGKVTKDAPLMLTSQMPEHGVIFSDGIEGDFLEFNSGTQAVITVADEKGHLVV